MAKGKSSKGRNYESKGERPNVNKKVRNDVKRNRLWSPESIAQSEAMISKEKRDVMKKAEDLHRSLGDKVTYAACVQAVKTDYVSTLKSKMYEKGVR